MPFESSQTLIALDQVQAAVGANRNVGETAGAVAADSAAGEAVESDIDALLEERPASIGAHTASVLGSVKRADGGSNAGCLTATSVRAEDFAARKHAVAETAVD